jgi:hypothetical protein
VGKVSLTPLCNPAGLSPPAVVRATSGSTLTLSDKSSFDADAPGKIVPATLFIATPFENWRNDYCDMQRRDSGRFAIFASPTRSAPIALQV